MLNNVIMLPILVDRITMVEKDEDVAAVWQAILNGGAEWLADEIAYFQLTPDSAKAAISINFSRSSMEYRVRLLEFK